MITNVLRNRRAAQLLKLLAQAETILRSRNWNTDWAGFDSAGDFADELRTAQEQIRQGDLTVLQDIYVLFLPTGAWDDTVGVALGISACPADEILSLISSLRR